MNDLETFELCKEVYGRTEWGDYPQTDFQYAQKSTTGKWDIVKTELGRSWPKGYYTSFPLYTSDYLLEKLSAITDHVSVRRSNKISIDASNDEKGNWYAHYWFKSRRVQVKSDTPLKALLKLTLALHEAGEL